MTQLHLFYPARVDVDGVIDLDGFVTYIGAAHYSHGDGIYVALARVGQSLARVELKVRPTK